MIRKLLDKQLIKYLLLFYLGSFIITTVSGVLSKLNGSAYTSFNWAEMILSVILRYGSKLVFIFTAIFLIRYLFLRKTISRWTTYVLHFFFAIGLAFYSNWSQTLLGNWFYGFDDKLTFDDLYVSALLGTDYNFFVYFTMVVITYAYYFFQKQKDYEVKQSKLQTQLLDSKIQVLQSQLQPHFLFNALNDISALVDDSPEKAQNAIADLSDMLRQTLNLKDTKYISIKEELALLDKYIEIEKIRYDNKLEFIIDVDDDLAAIQVPPLLLQPIVENSIKHGFSYEHDVLRVQILIQRESAIISIRVVNNGKPVDVSNISYGTGISNVISRLDTLYEGNFVFEMSNEKNNENEVVTTIQIPV